MRKRHLYKIFGCICIFFIATTVKSQNNFEYKAAVESIPATKFYKIDLSPLVVAKSKSNLTDIRILDEDGKQVSYILKNDFPTFKNENIIEFPIIKNVRESDKQTHIVFQNATNKPVNNILIFIKNTDAPRAFSVSASDDSVHWFIIKENISLDNSVGGQDENIIQTLSFSPANYKYFQLIILGENLLPFNIVKAGTSNEDLLYGKYVIISGHAITQHDSSNKKTYINLKFDNKYQINKLVVDVEGPKYFRRRLAILENSKTNYNLLLDDYLRSGSINSFVIDAKNNELLLIIENEDNIPLKVKAVKAFQLNTYLLTYLQAGKKYFLYFGDSTIEAPKYDLAFFSDSIGSKPAEIFISSFERNKILKTANKSSPLKNNQLLLWGTVLVSLFILSFFTFKIIKEINMKSGSN